MKAELKRLTDRAADEGLLDVAYATVDSPFGSLLIATTPRGLVKVSFPTVYDSEETLEELAVRISPRVLESPDRLDDVRRQLDRYFEGQLHEFDLRLDWRLTEGFRKRA
jgi:methylated-DNA-[protein]-cysteine S-methyltransferase